MMHRLGYRRRPPAYGTLRGLFARLDARAFEAAVARWVAHLLGDGTSGGPRAVAIDGKSSRGSRAAGSPAVHLLAALDQRTGCVLAQARVPAETDEHKAALTLLEGMALRGRVVTGDAAFRQRDLCRRVVDDGGHYLLEVADNQPTLEADDVTMGEDGNRTRAGSGPQAPATLRNLAISKLRLDGATNIAAALRRNAARVRDLLVSLRILKN